MLRLQDRQRWTPRRRMSTWEQEKAQPTSSVVRTLETEDDGSAKRQRVMAGMPILHETDVDVNVDAHEMVVVAAMPDDRGQWTQRVIDWDNKYHGAKSGNLLDTQKVYEGRFSGGWPPWSWWRGGRGHCCGRTRGSHWVWGEGPPNRAHGRRIIESNCTTLIKAPR